MPIHTTTHRSSSASRLLMTSPIIGGSAMLRAAFVVACTVGAAAMPLVSWRINEQFADPSRCRLFYSAFHGIFIIPLLVILYILARPFLTRLDRAKLALLPLIAFAWTTPWDNVLVRNRAWSYPQACVLARVGYVPIEEYAFFILQSLLTTLFTILATRWATPTSLVRPLSPVVVWTAPTFAIVLTALGTFGLFQGSRSTYYMSMILWWASTPLSLLLWGSRRSLAGLGSMGQIRPWLVSVLVPTVYLCCADLYAMRRGTWHISRDTSLKLFVVPDLPVEEAFFFLMTNTILVSACFAFDRVVWQLRTHNSLSATPHASAPLSPSHFTLAWSSVPRVWSCFLHLDEKPTGTPSEQADQQRALRILARASKSFHLASLLLPWDLRVDLGCLYAFARAMDDLVDEPDEIDARIAEARIGMLRDLVEASFGASPDATSSDVHNRIEGALAKYRSGREKDATGTVDERTFEDLRSSARAASALRNLVPQHLWDELLNGYQLDSQVGGPHFEGFDELIGYAQDVAGCIGEMCVRVVLGRSGCLVDLKYRTLREVDLNSMTSSGRSPNSSADAEKTVAQLPRLQLSKGAPSVDPLTVALILRDARRMGCGLQLVNIARDVVKDAEQLGRCYLALPERDDGERLRDVLRNSRLRSSAKERTPSQHPLTDHHDSRSPSLPAFSSTIHAHQLALLDVADVLLSETAPTIDLLPGTAARTGLRAACTVYASIATAIRRGGAQKCAHPTVSKGAKVRAALRAVYLSG